MLFFHQLFIFSITPGESVSAALGFCAGKRLEAKRADPLSRGEEVSRGMAQAVCVCVRAPMQI